MVHLFLYSFAQFCPAYIALCSCYIASLYYLSHDGRLRQAKIAFFLVIGLFAIAEGIAMRPMQYFDRFGMGLLICVTETIFAYYLRRSVHQELQHHTERIAASLDILTFRLDTELRIIEVSPHVQTMFGIPSDRLRGKSLLDFATPDSRDTLTVFAQQLRTGKIPNEITYTLRDGDRQFHLLQASQIDRNDDGTIIGVSGSIRNITDEIEHYQLLLILRDAMDRNPVGITITKDNQIVYVNETDAAQHGYAPAELIGQPRQIYAPEDLFRSVTAMPAAPVRQYLTLNVTKQGVIFPVMLTTGVIPDHSRPGQTLTLTLCEPVTKLYPAAAQMIPPQDLLILGFELDFSIFFMSDALRRLLGIMESVCLPTLDTLFSRPSYAKMLHRVEARAPQATLHHYTMRHESDCPIHVSLSLFYGVAHYYFVGFVTPPTSKEEPTS